MDILVTESIPGAGGTATERLEAAGHRVHRCHEPSSAFPCAGVRSECPLDEQPIDLVLAVRPHIRTTPTTSEIGVTCALRQRIPVAVTGQTLLNPFEPFGAAAIEEELVEACERVAAARRPEHEAAAAAAVQSSLATAGHEKALCDVSVHRDNGRLRVRVSVPKEVPEPTRKMLAVRVIGRLRNFDPHAEGVDVAVATIKTVS